MVRSTGIASLFISHLRSGQIGSEDMKWSHGVGIVGIGSLAVVLLGGLQPRAARAAEEPVDQEAPVVAVEAVEVSGKRIENVEDVKREFARRPGSNILIEEKQITESRALNLQDVLQFAPGVRFQSRFGADEGQFQIRGTSLRNNVHHRGINILINGIFFGDADGFSDLNRSTCWRTNASKFTRARMPCGMAPIASVERSTLCRAPATAPLPYRCVCWAAASGW